MPGTLRGCIVGGTTRRSLSHDASCRLRKRGQVGSSHRDSVVTHGVSLKHRRAAVRAARSRSPQEAMRAARTAGPRCRFPSTRHATTNGTTPISGAMSQTRHHASASSSVLPQEVCSSWRSFLRCTICTICETSTPRRFRRSCAESQFSVLGFRAKPLGRVNGQLWGRGRARWSRLNLSPLITYAFNPVSSSLSEIK